MSDAYIYIRFSTSEQADGDSLRRQKEAALKFVLENGLVMLAKETRKTPAVSINLAIRAGSVCDPAASPGAMNLLARVIDRGHTRAAVLAMATVSALFVLVRYLVFA